MTLLRRIDTRAFGVLLALGPAVGALIGFLALGGRVDGAAPVGRRPGRGPRHGSLEATA